MNFSYMAPTKVVIGKGCVQDQNALFKGIGRKAFVLTGRTSAARIGALADVQYALEKQGISYVHCNKVAPNPTIEQARELAAEAAEAGVDFVVAIGGGSPMDAGKAVAVLACNPELTDEELFDVHHFERVLPVVAIPTTAGTGAEVTQYAILTDCVKQTKRTLAGEQLFPRLALLDAAYMMELPAALTHATMADAMSHAVEGYLSARSTPMGRFIALEGLRQIGACLPALEAGEALRFDQREQLLYGSMLAGMVIAQSGTTIVHAMGYSLTYFKQIEHGRANGLLLGAYMAYIAKNRPEAAAEVLAALGLADPATLGALMGQLLEVEALSEAEIEQFTQIAIQAGHVANTVPPPTADDIARIYRGE